MKVITSLLMLLISVSTFAQYDPEAKEVLDAMSNKYKSINAFSADFTQTLTNEAADLNETLEGSIAVMDDKYQLKVAGQEIYNDGEDVWSYNPEINEVTVSTYDPEEAEISLANIWDLYREGFKYILLADNENGNRVIDLDPVDRNKSYYKIRMIVSPDNSLKSFMVFESSGNKYTYKITDFRERNDLTSSDFTFNPDDYDGVEVIDFRD